jgi:hypothetical protein
MNFDPLRPSHRKRCYGHLPPVLRTRGRAVSAKLQESLTALDELDL